MIRPLRKRHLWLVGLVTLAAGALLILALGARPDRPIESALPGLEESGRP